MSIAVFLLLVGATLALSFWLGRKGQSASGYFAAHGQVGWFVNGIAFAGDYLSAASFLGICGMIAFYGYDGFLYSIGFLAGWVVALFAIAEPIRRLGRFTFADALNARFQSRGITLAASASTLLVSVFYLIPQMVGAGSLIRPLLGLPHWAGVLLVGTTVILIVVTAGMVSTTWVQFIKGGLLVAFCAMLAIAIFAHGIHRHPIPGEVSGNTVTYSGPKPPPAGLVADIGDQREHTDALGPLGFLAAVGNSSIVRWTRDKATPSNWSGEIVRADQLLLPGGSPTFKGIRSERLADRLDFVSLMLALFAGTASLPHILIRYYTVRNASAARKSTVVGITAIGLFYILTLFIGLGAMVCGNLDPSDSNMAAPLLARTFGELPFAIITAIAFTTILGTVSGLILAASGAVAHDLIENVFGHRLKETAKVGAARWAALGTGLVAMLAGILFKDFNASFLVGWAFNVAASANLPALVMLLFWPGTTKWGVIASILVGLFSSLAWLLLSAPAYIHIYKLPASQAIAPFSQPGLATIPLAFITLVAVSLATRPGRTAPVRPTP